MNTINITKKMSYIFLINILLAILIYPQTCSNYYNPNRFYEAPKVLQDMLLNIQYKNKFIINKYELYKYDANSIAEEINDDFGGFWSDYIGEDGYEMTLIPEYNLFQYKHKYFSLKVTIYGVKGDATKYKNTKIKYTFYDYTNQVAKYKKCIKINKK
jgi:hypothetical protein